MDLADLTRDLEALQAEALAAVEAAPDVATLEALELDVLGKKGRLTGVLRGIGALPLKTVFQLAVIAATAAGPLVGSAAVLALAVGLAEGGWVLPPPLQAARIRHTAAAADA